MQWQIQGRAGAGGPAPPLLLDQTEARRAEKIFFGDRHPSSPPPPPSPSHYLWVWMTGPLPYLKVWILHCKWYLFRIPSLELCIPFTFCKCPLFNKGINVKTKRFLDYFSAIKCIYYSPFGPFYRPRLQISQPFLTSLKKGLPFGRSLAPRKHGTWGLMPAGTPEVVNR